MRAARESFFVSKSTSGINRTWKKYERLLAVSPGNDTDCQIVWKSSLLGLTPYFKAACNQINWTWSSSRSAVDYVLHLVHEFFGRTRSLPILLGKFYQSSCWGSKSLQKFEGKPTTPLQQNTYNFDKVPFASFVIAQLWRNNRVVVHPL